LLHPKIVRACTLVLTDWTQIPTKALKAAVTILHRIAYGCSCPGMLYQVSTPNPLISSLKLLRWRWRCHLVRFLVAFQLKLQLQFQIQNTITVFNTTTINANRQQMALELFPNNSNKMWPETNKCYNQMVPGF